LLFCPKKQPALVQPLRNDLCFQEALELKLFTRERAIYRGVGNAVFKVKY
jgi:hypothetical protein